MSRWASAITHTTLEDPESLLANPANIKIHPFAQAEAMEAALNTIGWVQPVIQNDLTGNLLDGHLRVMLALQRHERTVPVAHVQVDPALENAALGLLARTTYQAQIDPERLDTLLRSVSTDNAVLADLLTRFAEEAGALAVLGDGTEAALDTLHAEDPSEEIALRVGEVSLTISKAAFDAWAHEIRLETGGDQDAVNAVIRRRLELP